MSNYYINSATGSFRVGEKMLEWEPCPERLGPRLPVEQPRRTERKAVIARRVGSICCSSVQSPTHLSRSKTLRNTFEPFQIKWEVYFSGGLCPLVFIVSSLCFFMYMCIVVHGYATCKVLPLWTRFNLEAMVIKWYSHFPKLQHYWRLTISCLCHI